MVQRRLSFTVCYRQLKRQRSWLVALERRLDPPEAAGQPPATPRAVKRRVKEFLAELEQYARRHPQDASVVAHLCNTFRQRPAPRQGCEPRLFACYAWPERYRTNNALETFFGRLRTRQRQIHGRKSVHEFIIRYGEWAIYLDPTESFEQVLKRFQQFDQAEFDQAYARFLKAQQRLQVLYRFRHQPDRCLEELEQQWAEAVRRKSAKTS